MFPAPTPKNEDDEPQDLPEEREMGESTDEMSSDDPAAVEDPAMSAEAEGDPASDATVTADDAWLASPVTPIDPGLPALADAGGHFTDEVVTDAPESPSEPFSPAVDRLASLDTSTPSILSLPPADLASPERMPAVEESASATSQPVASTESPGPSAAVTTSASPGPTLMHPTVLVSLLEPQARWIVEQLLATQRDRHAQELEELVERKIEAAFAHRACEERAVYGE